MKRYILCVGIVLSILLSCTDEEMQKQGWVGDQEVWTTLKFGHTNFDKIDISTREIGRAHV